MSDGILTKTQTVMHRVSCVYPNTAYFDDLDESDPSEGVIRREVYLALDLWNEMGRPGTITVTIEPGDKLNQ